MTDIVIAIADAHINSTVGLCPPEVNLDDGGTYHPSPAQRWLWRSWLNYIGRVKKISEDNGNAPITLICNGDMVEGDSKNRSKQTITRNKATILSMAADVLKPLLDISTRAFYTRGTGAHVGKSAELEEELAKDCTITAGYSESVYSWWSLLAEFSGVLFDVSHHGRIGSLPWTRTNPLGQLAVRVMLDNCGGRCPDVVIRSHNHRYASTHDTYPVMVCATPAWQLATEYSSRLGVPEVADVGGLVFVCKDKGYTWQKILFTPEATKPWKVSAKKKSSAK